MPTPTNPAKTTTLRIQGRPGQSWWLTVDGDIVVSARPINNDGWELYGLDKWCNNTGRIAVVDVEEDVLEALEALIPQYTVVAMAA